MQVSQAPSPFSDDAESERLRTLQDLLEQLQVAGQGSLAFDAAIVDAFGSLRGIGPRAIDGSRLRPGPHCSTVLVDVVELLPADYNFSLGRRDGVCWAWIQPNDGWRPGDGESRHDHPGGSGLAVAGTPVLAVACAAIRLHIRLIEHRQRAALHRLMYVSRSVLPDRERDLCGIAADAQRNNARHGLTGVLLLFEDGVFCQVLEGAFTQLESRFARIRDDPRHTDLRVLQAEPIGVRRYPGWPMGLARDCRFWPDCPDTWEASADAMLSLLVALEYQREHWVLAE